MSEAPGRIQGQILDAAALAPDAGAAPRAARVLAQARFDRRIMLRNGEQVLLTLVLPALALVGLTFASVPDLGAGPRVDVVVPGVLALAVLSTAFTGQAIGTGFDRRYGVLRLLGTTPLGRGGLLAGRALAVLAVEAVQIVILSALGLALGWRPHAAGLAPALLLVLAGTAAFVALGLLLAGTLRSEAVLAVANLVWLVLATAGAVLVPAENGTAWARIAHALPSGALGSGLRAALQDGRLDLAALGVLLAWAAGGALAAVRWFHWD